LSARYFLFRYYGGAFSIFFDVAAARRLLPTPSIARSRHGARVRDDSDAQIFTRDAKERSIIPLFHIAVFSVNMPLSFVRCLSYSHAVFFILL